MSEGEREGKGQLKRGWVKEKWKTNEGKWGWVAEGERNARVLEV